MIRRFLLALKALAFVGSAWAQQVISLPETGSQIAGALSPALTPQIAADTFTSVPDGALIGRLPFVGPSAWEGSGVGVGTLRIAGGYIRADSNAYAFLPLGAT